MVQTELGVTRSILQPDSNRYFSPGLSVSPVANMMLDTWEGNHRLYPQVDLNAYWTFGKHESFAYLGLSQWFEFTGKRAHEEPQETNWPWSPPAGVNYSREKMQYGLEVKYLAPTHSNQYVVVDYFKPFGNKGATGVYLTFMRRF